MPSDRLLVAFGDELFNYDFGPYHPLNRSRTDVFVRRLMELKARAPEKIELTELAMATEEEISLFHTREYIEFVKVACSPGSKIRYLDYGDTPAYPNCFVRASTVVGTTLKLLREIASGRTRRAFNPVGGLHHARRNSAGGFCIFNDAGIAIEYALRRLGYKAVAYVDIDAHHGDGVYYDFEDDPRVIFFDIHQDGRTLYPGTGFEHERGRGEALGRKMNAPLPPYSGDEEFLRALEKGLRFLDQFEFDIVFFQAGADGLAGDPLTNLMYSRRAHESAARALLELAERKCGGRILAFGGGGYNPVNVGEAWSAVVEVLAGV